MLSSFHGPTRPQVPYLSIASSLHTAEEQTGCQSGLLKHPPGVFKPPRRDALGTWKGGGGRGARHAPTGHHPRHQASLSITNSRSSPRLTSIESLMPSSHLILCRPLLLLPPIPPSIRVFSNESTPRMRWPKYWTWGRAVPLARLPLSRYLARPGAEV